MNILDLRSDQLNTWSANARYSFVRFASASHSVATANAGIGDAVARLAYRTIQALRQARLQVRRWPWPWPQVLPFCELPRPSPANGLRAASRTRRCRGTSGKLPSGPRDHRRDLRDQPRTVTAPRGALRRTGEPVSTVACHPHRSTVGRRTHRQHARSLACRRVHAETVRGAPQ
jgi:hypothetical protein